MNRRDFFRVGGIRSLAVATAPVAAVMASDTASAAPVAGTVVMDGNDLSMVRDDGSLSFLGISCERDRKPRQPSNETHNVASFGTERLMIRTVEYTDE
jgi:hypothetical protein